MQSPSPSPTKPLGRWFSPAIEAFDLNPKYFPEATKTLFSVDAILKHGMIALGFKAVGRLFRTEKKLNVGFLTPAENIAAAQAAIQGKFESQAQMNIQAYQIQASQLLTVLDQVFGISLERVLTLPDGDVHPELRKAAELAMLDTAKAER